MEKLVPSPFLKNQNWGYLWMNDLKFYSVCFYYMFKSSAIKIYKTEVQRPLVFTSYKGFLKKTKIGLELVSLPHFLLELWREIFLTLYSINWRNFFAWLPLLLEILGIMCGVIVCFPGCEVLNFEINLSFPIKPFFSIWPNRSAQKIKYFKKGKCFKDEIKSNFHHF